MVCSASGGCQLACCRERSWGDSLSIGTSAKECERLAGWLWEDY